MTYPLVGNWKKGLAYDLHTTASTYLGVDEFGHDRFDNERSEMGELVYRLKYRGDRTALASIVKLLDSIKGVETFDLLVPIPPTNKSRIIQPVPLIAAELGARRDVRVLADLLGNDGDAELKGISDPVEREERLNDAIKLNDERAAAGKKILLIDDLYRSGSTLRVATKLLYEKGGAASVNVLTMTKTRSVR
ncbi:MAG: ComF family protein [Alphaproteobacteria bacterium]|nr:ComF family protein [Alphaproteobacteria bacterium]